MIKLEINEYHKIKPLIAHQDNEFIFVFVHSVIDGNQSGKIFVNHIENPTAGLIASSGGKYYLFGKEDDPIFNRGLLDFLANTDHHSNFYDLYCSSDTWIDLVKKRLDENVVELSRSHYILRKNAISNVDKHLNTPEDFRLRRMDEELYERYKNEIDDSYALLWESPDKYLDTTFGYCYMKGNDFVSVCNTFYIGGGYIEPDIITLSDYRNQGMAYAVCQTFIEHSVQQNLIPYWDCDAGNEASNKLVTKLGFDKVGDLSILWWHESKEVIKQYLSKYNYTK